MGLSPNVNLLLQLHSIYNISLPMTSFVVFALSRITEGKEMDDPKTIPLKIFAKDIGNCAYVRFSSFPVLLLSAQKENQNCLIAYN